MLGGGGKSRLSLLSESREAERKHDTKGKVNKCDLKMLCAILQEKHTIIKCKCDAKRGTSDAKRGTSDSDNVKTI